MAQCISCQFQNMPGVTHCGRCGTSLMLATAAINVHPRRATKWARTWRKSILARVGRSFPIAWASLAGRINLEADAPLPPVRVLVRLILPGWAQMICGRVILGRWLLGACGVCALLAFLFFGTALGSFFIAATLTLHAASVYDVAYYSTASRGGRLSRFAAGCAVLLFGLYYSASTVVQRVALPLRIRVDRPPLRDGDVLLLNQLIFQMRLPRAGDLVEYDISQGRYQGMPATFNAVYVVRGQRIDRILAGPGQAILWENGTLSVDGQPSTLQPLNPGNPVARLSFTVPLRHYCILPSTEAFAQQARYPISDAQWIQWSTVPVENIQGLVYWRHWPWWRATIMR